MARRTSTLTADVQGWSLIVAVMGAALAYGPRGGVDGIVVSKFTIVAVTAIVAVAAAGFAAIRLAEVRLPGHPATIAAGVLALAMIVRVAFAADPFRGMFGIFGRWNGLVLYLACLTLFAVAAARNDDRSTQRFLRAVVVGSFVVVAYAFDEVYLGIGPQWGRGGSQVAGTLGNPNFFGAWVACMMGPALALALDRQQPRGWRATGAVAIPLLVWALDTSTARQAIYVVAAGIAIVGLAWAVDRVSRRLFLILSAGVGAAALGGVVLTVLGARGSGPAGFLADDQSVIRRIHHWQVSWRMITEHPLGGIGPGMWADRYREFRSLDEAMFNPALRRAASSAHNAPLQFLSEWGLLVGFLYLAVIVLVTVAMVRELLLREGPARLRYAGVSALWVGYLLQALVSIDTPSLAVLGWVSAGLVLAPQVQRQVTRALPWRPWKRNRRQPTPARAQAANVGVAAVAALVAWVAVLPIRADAAASGGEVQIDANAVHGPGASTRATQLAPWEERYWQQLAVVLLDEGQSEVAASVLQHAHEVGSENFAVAINAARVFDAAGEANEARRYYERTLEMEPHVPELRVEVARFALEQTDRAWAEELIAAALRADPEYEPALDLQEEL